MTGSSDFSARLNAFLAQDDLRTQWVRSMHDELSQMTEKYDTVCRDLEREKMAGRGLQEESKQWEGRFNVLDESVKKSSFVLVLLDADADAYMFKPEYYCRSDGGQKAAHDLQAAVKHYIGQTMPELSRQPIVLKAFANADGLAETLVRSKITRTTKDLWDFAMNFSQACGTFDFVLVGSGKDRADEKIKELLQLFFENPSCCHIIFGACHDNGYVRTLEKVVASEEAKDRLTLLHSFHVGREFGPLNIKKSTTMGAIFRTEPLSAPVSPVLSSIPTAGQCSTASSASDARPANQWALSWARAVALQDAGQPGAMAARGSPVSSRKLVDLPPGTILVNAQNQRVDAELPLCSEDATARLHRKTVGLNLRFCRMFQLSGVCYNKKSCEYSHASMPEDEKIVYRYFVRRQRCHIGPGCRDRMCSYGHHCSCKQQKCKLKFQGAQHGVDVASAVIWNGE
ncbi:hypothetical protein ACHAQA_000031 [Verticillium albo-atrum]